MMNRNGNSRLTAKASHGTRRVGFGGSSWARWIVVCAAVLALVAGAATPNVVINELMYRPPVETNREEFVELLNLDTNVVDLAGWKFTTGIRFTFTNSTRLAPGECLVVVQDARAFTNRHPAATNFVGDWEGILSNSGQLVELVDAQGRRVDSVRYADDGEWARRVRDVADAGHRGWTWASAADGQGHSLELINARLPNQHGQNWAPSLADGGSPGRSNGVASTNLAPMVLEFSQFPLLPTSVDPVTVTVRLLDEATNGLGVFLHHRVDGAATFEVSPMADDGLSGDGFAGDGVYGAVVPAQTNGTIVEFHVEVRDREGAVRRWPAAALDDGVEVDRCGMLYQVDDTVVAGTMPIYRLILTAADRAELRQINRNSPAAPFSTSDQTRSHAQFSATFISVDGTGTEVRQMVLVRNRGNGSRSRLPQSVRVAFRNDELWKEVSALNLNSQNPHSQLLGSALYRQAGLPVQQARPVRVRVNAEDQATSAAPSYGFYVANEVLNSEFAARAFPRDSSGNIYRGIRLSGNGADLHYEGEDPAPYRKNYFKQSNTSLDDWRDLIGLTRVLTETPDADYAAAVVGAVDMEEWMLFFALETLVDNKETNLGNGNDPGSGTGTGQGDDYSLYSGREDPRFRVVPYDLDTILNQGSPAGILSDGLFRMAANPTVARFVQHPEFAPVYYRRLLGVADSVLHPDQFSALLDQVLGGLVPPSVMDAMRTFAQGRREFVLSQIPLRVSAEVAPGLVTTNLSVALGGRGPAVATRSIRVNGQLATWSAWEARWTNGAVALMPGVNRILVQAFDENGREIDRTQVDIRSDQRVPTNVSGTIVGNTTWTPDAGPYLVTASISVPSGSTLTIAPGTTVYFAPGTSLSVAGTGLLVAEGTETQRIRLTRLPDGTNTWTGLRYNAATGENRLVNVDVDYATGDPAIHATGSKLLLDAVVFSAADGQYVSLDDSSFIVRRCVFPTISGAELIHGRGLPAMGYGIFEGNWFGGTTGLNDIIDFTGGQRPGAILQILDNVFSQGSDDNLDLDGTDAHIEGNLFLNTRATASSTDSSSAISGGHDGSNTSRLVIVRNLFFNQSHIALAKEGNYYTLVNNTAVLMNQAGVLFDEPGRRVSDGVTPGRGAWLDGNIIWDSPMNFEDAYVNDPVFGTVDVRVDRSILSGADLLGNGVDNLQTDPRLVSTDASALNAENVRDAFRLRPGSPALGTGPNGLDRGALVPAGASISGEPRSPTWRTEATLSVGGPGYRNPGLVGFTNHYRFRVNDGVWSQPMVIDEPVRLSGLTNGSYVVEVVGENSAGVWQSTNRPTRSRPWVVDTAHARLLLNEVLASNRSAVPNQDLFPDLIELFNDSGAPVEVGGMGLTDNPASPFKFTIPAGTTIPAEGYLVVFADNDRTTPGLHAGFNLKVGGDDVHLFDRADRGARLLDSVVFGTQLPDWSIGRRADGSWGLCRPTFGFPNVTRSTGDPARLRINEWLAAGRDAFADDFLELFNPDTLPMALGGLFVSDNPDAWPDRHAVAPLTFIAAGGHYTFIADGQIAKGPEHLGFSLASEQGVLGLLTVDRQPIDVVFYGPQRFDVSEGRSPSGSDRLAFFSQPTPGGGNAGAAVSASVQTLVTNLVSITNQWHYFQDGAAPEGWQQSGFDDAGWPVGRALLYVESDPLPAPKLTPLTLGKITYYFRTSFRVSLADLAGYALQARSVLDDGAVVFLNGRQILSYGMATNAPVEYVTRADRTVNDAEFEGPFDFSLTNLVEGDNVLAVEVHQASSSSTDITFGLELWANKRITNALVDEVNLRLSEVLAASRILTNAAGPVPDWIEVENLSSNAVDLAGLSLTDDTGEPSRWVFPTGARLDGFARWVVSCDGNAPASATNTGFALSANGDGVFLFDRPTRGGLLDSVVFGMQVPDLSIGRLEDGTWALTLPTPGAANLAALLGPVGALRINEWMALPQSGADWLELFNPGQQPVALGGLALTDDLTRRGLSPIPPLSFIGAGRDGFAVFVADDPPSPVPDHVRFKLSGDGEGIGLFTAGGALLDSVVFGVQRTNVAQGRLPDGAATFASFEGATSPGEANWRPLDGVVIHEVLAHTDPPLADAIEVFNPTSVAVDMGGWYLSHSRFSLREFRIPEGTVLAAGGYRVFHEVDFNPQPGVPPSFALDSAHGDEVHVSQVDARGELTGYRASIVFGATENGVSLGRFVTSAGVDFVPMSRRTFGVDDPSSIEAFRLAQGAPNSPPRANPIVISEVHFHPVALEGTNVVEQSEWEFIELANATAASVALFDPAHSTNTWRLRGGADFDFPTGVVLPPGGFVVVVNFDPANTTHRDRFQAAFSPPAGALLLGPFAGRLANEGGRVTLMMPDRPQTAPSPDAGFVPYVMMEQVTYTPVAPWPAAADGNGESLQRRRLDAYGNESLNWMAAVPTPGRWIGSLPTGDADADGLPDEWERLHGLRTDDPTDAAEDGDGDGLSNLAEYLAGTDPRSGASVLRILSVEAVGAELRLSFQPVGGRSYRVEARETADSGVWGVVAEVAAGPTSQVQTISLPWPGTSARFFRLTVPQLP